MGEQARTYAPFTAVAYDDRSKRTMLHRFLAISSRFSWILSVDFPPKKRIPLRFMTRQKRSSAEAEWEPFWVDVAQSQSPLAASVHPHHLINTRGSASETRKWTAEDIHHRLMNNQCIFALQTACLLDQKPDRFPDPLTVRSGELLVRLVDDDVVIGPGQFLPKIAKEDSMMHYLFLRSVEAAGIMSRNLADKGHELCTISVNITNTSLAARDLVKQVVRVCDASQAKPDQIVLEIFEDVSPHVVKDAVYRLKELREMGIGISIDDAPNFQSIQNMKILGDARIRLHSVKVSGEHVAGLASPKTGMTQQMTIAGIASTAKRFARYLTLEGAPYFTAKDLAVARQLSKDYPEVTWLLQSPPPAKDTD